MFMYYGLASMIKDFLRSDSGDLMIKIYPSFGWDPNQSICWFKIHPLCVLYMCCSWPSYTIMLFCALDTRIHELIRRNTDYKKIYLKATSNNKDFIGWRFNLLILTWKKCRDLAKKAMVVAHLGMWWTSSSVESAEYVAGGQHQGSSCFTYQNSHYKKYPSP